MAQGVLAYRDVTFKFPTTDDIESMNLRLRSDRRQAFSISGKSESVLLLAFEEVDIRLRAILDGATLIRDLEAFWSHAQSGKPWTYSQKDDDAVLTALEADAAAAATTLRVTNLDGIVVNGEYVLVHDLLGRNSSTNKLSSAQSKCDVVADYTYTGTAGGALAGAAKVGTDSIILTATTAASQMQATGPAVAKGNFLTFSVWYHSHTTGAWRLRITGGSVIKTGTAIPADTDVGTNWKNAQLTAYFPDAVASTTVSIENVTGGAGPDTITVDAWQATLTKQHATPWVDGATTVDTKTAALEGLAEIVKVSTIVAAGGNKDTLNLAAALRFPFKARDTLKSRRHWERAVALDARWPLSTNLLDQDFRLRFREIP